MNEIPLFDRQRTTGQLLTVYQRGLHTAKPRWDFGYASLTQAFPTLYNGTFYIIAPQNYGKSALQLNIAYNILVHDPDVFWVDISLDDREQRRLGYLMARVGGFPINLVHQAKDAPEEDKERRREAFTLFNKLYGDRYHLFALAGAREEEMRFSAEWITQVVGAARSQIGTDKKLLVTVDSFHDIDLERRSEDSNDRLGKISSQIKRSAGASDALYLLTSHTTKHSRKRELTADNVYGTVRLGYDADIQATLYNDVHVNRGNAEVRWFCQDRPGQSMPVHELNIIKSKVGDFSDIIWFNYYPQQATDFAVDDSTAQHYRDCVFNRGKSK